MSSKYEGLRSEHLYRDIFDVDAPSDTTLGSQVWPRRPGVFIRNTQAGPLVEGAEPAASTRELVVGQFGLVPPWVKSAAVQSESAESNPSPSETWLERSGSTSVSTSAS